MVKIKESHILPGLYTDGSKMDIRIVDVKDNEKDVNSNIIGWIVYGITKKEVVMLHFSDQSDEPICGIDYIIDYTKKVVI